jgi:hypothetical protein
MRVLLVFSLCLGLGSTALADTMECYNGILDTAEIDPPTKDVVRRRCGEPDTERNQGYEWVYRKSEFVYILRFDDDGELLDIQSSHTQ